MYNIKDRCFLPFWFGNLVKEMLVEVKIFRFLFCARSAKGRLLLASRVSSSRRVSNHS